MSGAAAAAATDGAPLVFHLPDLGEGLTEATVVRWLVQEGDVIGVDQPIVEVESAKACVEIPSPYAGRVHIRHGAAGDELPVGSPLVTVRPLATRPLIGFGPVEDEPTITGSPTSAPPPAQAPSPALTLGIGLVPGAHNGAGGEVRDAAGPPRVISPLVRRLARTAALDLAAVSATGLGGIILRADVDRALWQRDLAAHGPQAPAAEPTHPVEPAPSTRARQVEPPTAGADVDVVRIPLQGRRRVIAARMSRSRQEIPEATAWRDVDATALLAARAAMNSAQPDRTVSVLGLVGRFCVAGLARYPALNAHVDTEAGEIIRFARVHLGFAIAVEDSLTVGVVHDAQAANAVRLTSEIRRLTDQAREPGLGVADLTGGTFTVNNHGALGSDGAVPIINHPEVAQLAIGRIADRPWVVDGEILPRKIMQLTMTFDHRACDGTPVAGFLAFLAGCIEAPLTMLGEL